MNDNVKECADALDKDHVTSCQPYLQRRGADQGGTQQGQRPFGKDKDPKVRSRDAFLERGGRTGNRDEAERS